ncbi:pentatricopeptide repeat-containing protein At1g73710 [Prosopis cineraria]|uniref:pentatricopeptide repeat-containing protein At1g73710 n=1 Tax=Prosopis cineraria TaxID=364024 RepID=UPI00240F7279|nr:pentatricopeptide repeat-containing protein At1g73710 [Prosopis cineraria]XP_054777652.1 pentatricopeptide repeat-containing protein At1g73710 [Prosopis cineraria]XP_054777653.1 pentatricopeptide repeat-containing protein At1g73710 [Prosopis cineraria]XP_054777654.1 pentatricopeptide repeat-containing protein At1g73710 [Prosopis cineraria]XP_054777655.1 pentatricopeptide repeat-containing protein At1g73710 [Prosopis cineraria]
MSSVDMLCVNSSSLYSNFISNGSSKSQRVLSQLPPPKVKWSQSCLHLHSNIRALPASSSSIIGRRKKKKYGGVLPSILRSLEAGEDVESTLDTFGENLNPKEQTVVLKEQRSWERVIRVFDWFKSQKEYVPNVIHYNVVLRALGKAQRWDELRLCWVEMAKSGVLPTNNTYSTLVDVYGKAGLVKEALLWVKHMRLRGYFPDEVTMSTVVKVLKDAGEFDRADKFYKSWCAGRIELDITDLEDSLTDTVNGSGSIPLSFKHFLSTELFKTGGRIPASNIAASSNTEKSPGKPRLTSTYNTLIDLYGKAGWLKDAADVFADMLKSGVAMDTITFNTMIYICGSHGDLLEAESLLGKMEERGILPDTKTYNIFLSLYVNGGNIGAALSCYRRIREAGLFPDDVTYRALLGALCEQSMVQAVEALLDEMKNSRVFLDEHSLPGIIKMYINEGAFGKAKDLLHNCQANGGPSSKICVAIMDIFAEQGLWAEAENMFFRKRDFAGQGRDVAEYNVMIKAYGTAKLYDKAISLFKGMRNQGTWPDDCTYNSIIQMLSGADLVDQARELLTEMLGMKMKPSCQTFSAVIGCYARLGQLLDAVSVYQEMLQVGIKPNEVVYGSLINGFAEYGSPEEALKYFHKMEEYGIPANLIVLTSLLKAYCKIGSLEGTKAICERMKDLEGGLDIVACNSMIGLFADLGMVSEAELVFQNLREKGWADSVSYVTMMYVYKNMGMLDDAFKIAEEMKLLGLLKDCVSYNKVLVCYASNGKLRDCGELLHQMISRKFSLNEGTFKVLFTVLKKGGFPIEAVAQLESSYKDGKPHAQQAAITALYSLVGMHALAQESAQAFTESGTALDSFVYNVAIYCYGSAGDVDKAFNIYMKMQDEEVEPDLVTHINLVRCYGKAGMVEGVKRIYSQVKYGEIEPSESLFKAITDAYRMANRQDLSEMVSQEMRLMMRKDECSETETEDESGEASVGP